MKRSEFFSLVQPLTPKLYSFAHGLLPDDFHAEQLVVDSMNAFLIRERNTVLARDLETESKKDVQLLRRTEDGAAEAVRDHHVLADGEAVHRRILTVGR